VHLYSAPESRRNDSTVSGCREQVRLQCMYTRRRSVTAELWCSKCRRQTVPSGRFIDGETSLPRRSVGLAQDSRRWRELIESSTIPDLQTWRWTVMMMMMMIMMMISEFPRNPPRVTGL